MGCINDADIFLNIIRVIEEAIPRNCSKDKVDLILESVCVGNRITDK